MASKVEIFNLAYVQLAQPMVASTTTATTANGAMNAVYETTLDALLSEHPWNFATVSAVLAQVADTYTEWLYAYAYPVDCLHVLGLVTTQVAGSTVEYSDGTIAFGSTTNPVPLSMGKWEVALSNDGTVPLLLCDIDDAEVRYIKRMTNTEVFSPTFSLAFATRLAMSVCPYLSNDPAKLQQLAQLYGAQIAQAVRADTSEGSLTLPTSTPSIEARM
jgi:hypothetical protein